uniref:Aa_trans domain-containing protein n=1 Tax=Macrostomum lignano TaxID=282301 RepID=A0A1I8FT40_9PLAT
CLYYFSESPELPLAGGTSLVRTSFYDRYFWPMSDHGDEKVPIVGPSTCVSYTQTDESSFVINDPGASSSGGRGRAGTGPYLTTVREDEELMEVSSEQFSASAASPGPGTNGRNLGSGLRPRTRTMSNRFMSSVHKIRSYTQQSIHERCVRGPEQLGLRGRIQRDESGAGHRHHGRALRGQPRQLGLHRGHLSGRRPVLLHRLSASRLSLHTGCPRTGRRVRYLKILPGCRRHGLAPVRPARAVTIVSVVEMFGGMCLYIILLASTSSSLMKERVPSLNIYHWSCISTYATLPLTFITRMSFISWFSMLAVASLMSSIVSVLVFCFMHFDQLALTNMPGFDPTSFPVSFGIIVFSYCAHAVFPGIEECMRRPNSYPAMLTVSFGVAAIVKTIMGVMAVLIFGMATEQEFGRNLEVDADFSFISNSPHLCQRFSSACRSSSSWLSSDFRCDLPWRLSTRDLPPQTQPCTWLLASCSSCSVPHHDRPLAYSCRCWYPTLPS